MCDAAPCQESCPAGIDIKKFIRKIKFYNNKGALRTVREKNILAAVCGRICPQEELCKKGCNKSGISNPIEIGALHRFVADESYLEQMDEIDNFDKAENTGFKVAVVGSGPAGLAAAFDLVLAGHDVTVFESKSIAGGVLTNAIPEYRLPNSIVQKEINYIKSYGVNIELNNEITSVDNLFSLDFNAVLLTTGRGTSFKAGFKGEELDGVYTALEFLNELALNKSIIKALDRVIVIGGGDVAIDTACSCLRLGASWVEIICLEGPNEMPATKDELFNARAEGIEFRTRSIPLEIFGENGKVTGVKGHSIKWKESGLFIPSNAEPIENSEFKIPAEMVIQAIGQKYDKITETLLKEIDLDKNKMVKINKRTLMTSKEGVFAAGDLLASSATAVQAIKEGRKAAKGINKFLKSEQK